MLPKLAFPFRKMVPSGVSSGWPENSTEAKEVLGKASTLKRRGTRIFRSPKEQLASIRQSSLIFSQPDRFNSSSPKLTSALPLHKQASSIFRLSSPAAKAVLPHLKRALKPAVLSVAGDDGGVGILSAEGIQKKAGTKDQQQHRQEQLFSNL